MLKNNFCNVFEVALNTHQSAKNIVDFLQLRKSDFTGMGAYLNKYISINILNKILQIAVPKTSGVKWNRSFATWFILSYKQLHFGCVSERECCFKLGLSTSEADTQSDNSFSFFFRCFLPFAFTPTETMISHYNLPCWTDKACNLIPAHFIQPIRCFYWQFTLSRMCTHVGFPSRLKAQISSRNMHKLVQKKNVWMGKCQDLSLFSVFGRDGFFNFFF